MSLPHRFAWHFSNKLVLVVVGLSLTVALAHEAGAQPTFGGNAQHTATYSSKAQDLNSIHWTTSIDLNNTGGLAHYGAPVMTPANTVFVPVKTGATSGFKINVFNANTSAPLYTLGTDYVLPSHDWIPTYQPSLATSTAGTRLYYPGVGGTIYYITNVDAVNHGAPVQQVFYTSIASYHANASGFNSTVFINTPITSDSKGNVFFGFCMNGTAPAPLNTSLGGFARIDPNGHATYVLAGTAAGDTNIGGDSHNSGPALSNDQTTLYVAVKAAGNDNYAYLLGLDSTTLATKYKVFLHDPRNNNATNASVIDDSTASPMVGPDNDVYFGVFGSNGNGSRGFLLHFSGDLTVEKAPGGFGWDFTPGVVPASMVPSYTGTSPYLLAVKYNNYANAGNDSGDGVNRVALLDPTSTEVDAHSSSNGMLIMREVLTVIGPSADAENRGPGLPYAVREWCINTPGVNPATNSVFLPSEDGNIYRWNLVTNSLDQFVHLTPGLGEPYVPTIVGPDGQVYTLNGGIMSVAGALNGVGVALISSSPDVRNTVIGQTVTFHIAVTNTGTSGITPTGSVTLTDTTYAVNSPGVLTPTTRTLVSNLPLDGNGNATLSTTGFTADRHFITATYGGDPNFSSGSASLVQFVHANASTTKLTSSMKTSTIGQPVTFTATVAALPAGAGTPTGQVTFRSGGVVLAQLPVNGSGVATFTTLELPVGSDTLTATYASDTVFAASSGSAVQTVQKVSTVTTVSSTQNPSVYGQSVTFTANVTANEQGEGIPSGIVIFKSGNSTLGTATLDANGQGMLSLNGLATGSAAITAAYGGSPDFNTSSAVLTQRVNKDATTSTVMSSANTSVFGQIVTFSANVAANEPGAGIPTGTVTFKIGVTTVGTVTLNASGEATVSMSALPVGSATITVVYSGSTNFNGSSAALTQTVNKDATTSSVTSSANPSVYGHVVTFTGSVASNAPGAGVPTGTVTFKSGASTLATITVNASGQATLTVAALAVGSDSITVVYNGSKNFSSSTSSAITQKVTAEPTTTTVNSSLNPAMHGQAVTFTATVAANESGVGTPGGTVTFMSGASTLGTVTLSKGSASFKTSALKLGKLNITAVYNGSTNFLTSTSSVLVQTVY